MTLEMNAASSGAGRIAGQLDAIRPIAGFHRTVSSTWFDSPLRLGGVAVSTATIA
jgi:hypothetical protein